MSKLTDVQVYCDICNESFFYQFLLNPLPGSAGLVKKSILHGDHVLICNIDYNGAVRDYEVLDLHFTPMETLVADIAQGMLYLNSELTNPVHIDVYTSDIKLIKFFKAVISKMFEQAVWKGSESRRIVASTISNDTRLYADGIQISVGPSLLEDLAVKNSIKGVVLDIQEVEKNKIELEMTLDQYDFCAVIIPRFKLEGYTSAFTSFFQAKEKPFFIDSLSNKSLIELFEFIFAQTLPIFQEEEKEEAKEEEVKEEEEEKDTRRKVPGGTLLDQISKN
ncbi:MAG: hypothetical protein ACW98K_07500 [Candidatus Kariarchaeaceae archaeon]